MAGTRRPRAGSDVPGPSAGRLNRRLRRRDDTVREIVEVARQQVTAGHVLALRPVAAQMGMTAPALYRYVDNLADLTALVVDTVTDDLADRLTAAIAEHASDPAAGWAVFSAHLRAWTLAAPAEARLVMAGGARASTARPSTAPAARRPAPVRRLQNMFEALTTPLVDRVADHCPVGDAQSIGGGAGRVVESAWLRLCGFVTLEVLGVLDASPSDRCRQFQDTMRDVTRDIGLSTEWPRLHALARPVTDGSTRRPEGHTHA